MELLVIFLPALLFAMLIAGHVWAGYRISGKLGGSGGEDRLSTSYKLSGSVNGRPKAAMSGRSYIINGGTGTAAILAAVKVTSVSPASGYNSGIINISEIIGECFLAGAGVSLVFGSDAIEAKTINRSSASKIACSFDLTGQKKGKWNIVIVNTDGSTGELKEGFEIMTWAVAGLMIASPNPFDPSSGKASIIFELDSDAETSLYVFNVSAELVYRRDFSSGSNGAKAGTNRIEWDGIDSFSRLAANGVYFARLIERPSGKVLSKGKIAVVRYGKAASKGPDL
ncbi:MAG: hypothetical protein AABZ57_06325, partial [Candidatus Margulisiibacteriota bacterium]